MHVHMNPGEAAHYGVKQGDVMKLRVGGDAPVTFERVHVRVDPQSRAQRAHGHGRGERVRPAHARDIELFK